MDETSSNDEEEIIISIDRSGLLGMKSRYEDKFNVEGTSKSPPNALENELLAKISTTGPLSLADYVYIAMGHPSLGYYQTKEVIGYKGDFITAPELNQIFGELIGIWMIITWSQSQKPTPFHLVELGPGKGKLMMDILRTFSQFQGVEKEIHVHLVENSAKMRKRQAEALGVKVQGNILSEEDMSEEIVKGCTDTGFNVEWHWDINTLPRDGPLFCVANEFFDAIPVHQFQHTERGWSEVLVDVEYEHTSPYHLKLVLAPNPTPASLAYIGSDEAKRKTMYERLPVSHRLKDTSDLIEDQHSSSNPHVDKSIDFGTPIILDDYEETRESILDRTKPRPDTGIPIGQRIEVGPLRNVVMETLSNKIGVQGGAALIIDYGEDYPQAFTLQGLRGSEYAHILEKPGEVDISAHVDFSSLRDTVQRVAPNLKVFPVVNQGFFLKNMGIQERMESLCKLADCQEQEKLRNSVERLVSNEHMGELFKVLMVTQGDIEAPAGLYSL
eukprot:CAMPEP_0167752762 /NCGR_PEP_ID=MMETSP0110_2-20121227/7323_1 /TAXON_ID=629695 /ORGANISM="Gymnochlora sp., Strain CCMP2014" /LENGTH=498 /DNA_ID=CAMNT_0007638423 /DNA_START=40 /DNA_END=1536 /DNA_ORIENTATION=+